MADPSEPDAHKDFERRLNELGEKLDEARRPDPQDQAAQSSGSGFGIAMRMGSEFVVAVLIGGAIGWYLEAWMGSTPFMLFIYILFGFAAGTLNIIRAGKRLNMAKDPNQPDKANE